MIFSARASSNRDFSSGNGEKVPRAVHWRPICRQEPVLPRLFPGKCHTRLEGVLVDFPVLHDDEEILAGIGNEADVVERIAVDKEQVRERPLFHDA
jgi:hypothetical protein